MKNFVQLSSILLLFTLVACQNSGPASQQSLEEEKLHKKILAIHDEVMPRMGEINKLRKKLVESLDAGTFKSEEDIKAAKEAVQYLENADEGMMQWMHDYKKPSELQKDKSPEEVMAWLKEEYKKVEKVKYDIQTSIKEAKALLLKAETNSQ